MNQVANKYHLWLEGKDGNPCPTLEDCIDEILKLETDKMQLLSIARQELDKLRLRIHKLETKGK